MLASAALKIVAIFAAIELFLVGGLGALAAQRLGFAYVALTPVAFAVYGAAGFFVARVGGSAWLAGALIGFLDATSWALFGGFGPQPPQPEQTVATKVITVLVVTAGASLTGALGGLLLRRFGVADTPA
jgi:hypothetical protein